MSSQTIYAKKQMYERERSPSPSPEPHEPEQRKQKSKYRTNKQSEYQEYQEYQVPTGYQVPSKESYFFDRCDQPMVEICINTNSFQLLPDEIKFPMLQFICAHSHEGRPSVYGEYDAPPERETVESINGKGGYFLKMTAEAANIYLIWHNRQKNIYKFWGPSERAVRDAMNRIRGRIVKYVVHGQDPAHGKNPAHGKTPAHGHPLDPIEPISLRRLHNLADSPPPMTTKPMTMSLPQASKNYIKAHPKEFPASCALISCALIKEKEEKEEDNFRPGKLVRTDSIAISEIYGEEPSQRPFGLSRSMSMAF